MDEKLSQSELNKIILDDLSPYIQDFSNASSKPLYVDLKKPYDFRMKIYMFNCTHPPGGRALHEYKIQLIIEGQKRKQRGRLDDTDGRFIFIVGYARPLFDRNKGVYIFWDAERHKEFAFSANLQVKLDTLLKTTEVPVVHYKRKNGEILLACTRDHVMEAINQRLDMNLVSLLHK